MSNVWDRYGPRAGGDPSPTSGRRRRAGYGAKATIDALFALALGLYTYVNPVYEPGAPSPATHRRPPVDHRRVLRVETDAGAAVEGIAGHIEGRRKILGL